jgi:colanic acid biosynthesis glycosyl transferase WcaI
LTRRRDRLLVLTQLYRPEPNFITADVAEAMAQTMDVVVVTAHPNYPLGKFYPGTRWWLPRRSVENGITVWRLPLYPDHSLSSVRRGLSFLSFALLAAVFAPFVAGRPKVVWVYHGIFTTGLAALWFKVFYRARVVFTCADLWPECFLASGVSKHPAVLRLLFMYRRFINRWADLLICSTRGTMQSFAHDGIPRERMHYVPVWVDGIPDESRTPQTAPMRSIVYAGNLGAAQKLDTLIRAAAELDREGIDVRIDLYGGGTGEEGLKRLAHELGASNVTFHGRVPPERAFQASAHALGQYVALQPSPLFRMTIPSKLAFSFAAASPILVGLEGEAAQLAQESGGSFPFDPEDPASLVQAIRQLLELSAAERSSMSAELRNYYQKHFARNVLLEDYMTLLGSSAQRAEDRVASASLSLSGSGD